ncbi:hypothetical protein GCM10010106_32640 [Thermopolyspora flexuosa]|jgi:hypothetical protein|uniref:Mce-associated membrane protein n=1 Tax=Thermopolyspora flexuosa TaxID=103836 RepID=A0A543IT23_9ACTN|nr:hypothetical protein [Thermopolyspora flexuosa]TQM73707.1 hypothetical protein FHX40_0360 [Thermopolyspora flexuosa]GGM83485.1 hypothetical protein GCM10010106_32640 [Thermopolyspora flexuosa]
MSQGIDGRRVVFAAVVAVLAALGVYLLVAPDPQDGEAGPAGTPAAGGGEGTAAPRASGSAAPSPPASVNPQEFDIYAYLPWSREQLAASADVARRFLAQYATHRHDEDPISYAERLKSFTTTELATSLTRTVTDPRRVEQERADQVVSEGTARIRQIRTFGENSITWVGTATERITAASGRREVVQEYAVTTIQVGEAWKVYDFNLAEAGQEGDAAGPAPGGSGGEERAE